MCAPRVNGGVRFVRFSSLGSSNGEVHKVFDTHVRLTFLSLYRMRSLFELVDIGGFMSDETPMLCFVAHGKLCMQGYVEPQWGVLIRRCGKSLNLCECVGISGQLLETRGTFIKTFGHTP